jgi:hypothetical protein
MGECILCAHITINKYNNPRHCCERRIVVLIYLKIYNFKDYVK